MVPKNHWSVLIQPRILSLLVLINVIRGQSNQRVDNMFTVLEESPNGTEIEGVAQYLQSHLTGPLGGIASETQFQLLPTHSHLNKALHLNTVSGQLIVTGRIDRETICIKSVQKNIPSLSQSDYRYQAISSIDIPDPDDCSQSLTVLITLGTFQQSLIDHRQPEMHRVKLHLLIKDINDNSPHWRQSQYVSFHDPNRTGKPSTIINLQVLETAKSSTEHAHREVRIALPSAEDPDAGLNGFIRYRLQQSVQHNAVQLDQSPIITHGSNGDLPFILEEKSGGEWDIVSLIELDYEKQSVYEMNLIAADSGVPILSCTALLRIALIDVNDEAPVFSTDIFYPPDAALSEKTVPGTLILNLTAVDADASSINNRIHYTMVPDPVAARYFAVHPDGRITLRQWLDFESIEEFGSAQIDKSSVHKQGRSTKQLSFKVQAIDSAPSPYEKKGEAVVILPLIDENDEAPTINPRFFGSAELTSNGRVGAVTENSVVPMRLAYIHIKDPDFGGRDRVNCHLSDTTNFSLSPIQSPPNQLGSTFEIQLESQNDYILSLLKKPDREVTALLRVRIVCKDQAGNTNQETLRIHVLDINDNPPKFVQSIYHFNLAENTELDHQLHLPKSQMYAHRLGQVSAQDLDVNENAQIAYFVIPDSLNIFPTHPHENVLGNEAEVRLIPSDPSYTWREMTKPDVNELFHIDKHSGILYTLRRFDAENVERLRFSVIAVDQPTQLGIKQLTGTAVIEVHITDVNDCSPRFYVVQNDTNLRPREFVDHYVFYVSENKPSYWLLGQVGAEDADISWKRSVSKTNNEEKNIRSRSDITYFISPDSDPDVRKTFSLHRSSGHLRTLTSLDREQKAVYMFNILARDTNPAGNDGRTATVTVTVFVEDVNDNDPVFVRPVSATANLKTQLSKEGPGMSHDLVHPDVGGSSMGSEELINIPIIAVHKDSWSHSTDADGRPLLTLEATDEDANENGQIVYAIGAGNSENVFRLDENTGILRLSENIFNQHSAAAMNPSGYLKLDYLIRFEACDGGSPQRCALPIWVRMRLDSNHTDAMALIRASSSANPNVAYPQNPYILESRSNNGFAASNTQTGNSQARLQYSQHNGMIPNLGAEFRYNIQTANNEDLVYARQGQHMNDGYNIRPSSLVVSEAVIICLVVVFIVLLCAATVLFYLVRKKTIAYALGSRTKTAVLQPDETKSVKNQLNNFQHSSSCEPIEMTESTSVYRFNPADLSHCYRIPNMGPNDMTNTGHNNANDSNLSNEHALMRRNSEPLLDADRPMMPMYQSQAFLKQPAYTNTCDYGSLVDQHYVRPQRSYRATTPYWEPTCHDDPNSNTRVMSYGISPKSYWYSTHNPLFSHESKSVRPYRTDMMYPEKQYKEESYQSNYKVINSSNSGAVHFRGDSLPLYNEDLDQLPNVNVGEEMTYGLSATLRRHNYTPSRRAVINPTFVGRLKQHPVTASPKENAVQNPYLLNPHPTEASRDKGDESLKNNESMVGLCNNLIPCQASNPADASSDRGDSIDALMGTNESEFKDEDDVRITSTSTTESASISTALTCLSNRQNPFEESPCTADVAENNPHHLQSKNRNCLYHTYTEASFV